MPVEEGVSYRRSLRFRNYDYSEAGWYFVTICCWQRSELFGECHQGQMKLNDFGRIVFNEWSNLPKRFPQISLDVSIVMPNHFHGIIEIVGAGFPRPDPHSTRNINVAPIAGAETAPLRESLGKIIAYFKYQSAKHINCIRNRAGYPVWQRNYHDHIIRTEDALNTIRQYILDNPKNWDKDEYAPAITIRKSNSTV